MFITPECSVKHFFEFSQNPAFLCTPDPSVPMYRVVTSLAYNAPLDISVNLSPASQYYLRNMGVVLLLASVCDAMTGTAIARQGRPRSYCFKTETS